MTFHGIIDAQFDRAVEIVQGLPKTGPIQTDYEEKLTMYSLYKQATVGNVKPPRPGIWDMLGRAKWDAWAKHRDLDSYEAKWLYVDALVKVLRKYSDKTVARNLIEELNSYGAEDARLIRNQTNTSPQTSESSGSSSAGDEPNIYRHASPSVRNMPLEAMELLSGEVNFGADEARGLPVVMQPERAPMQSDRPPSSLSSNRYRTPLAGPIAMLLSPEQNSLVMHPHPGFEAPSSFAAEITFETGHSHPSSSYVSISPESSHRRLPTPSHLLPTHSSSRSPLPPQLHPPPPSQPVSRPTLERAIENVQVNLVALTERLESLESLVTVSSSNVIGRITNTSSCGPARSLYQGPRVIDELGLWSLVLKPLGHGLQRLRELAFLLVQNENHSPMAVVIRRLCLDATFLAFVLICAKLTWKKSGLRRKEIRAALLVLWRAILGSKPQNASIDRRLYK